MGPSELDRLAQGATDTLHQPKPAIRCTQPRSHRGGWAVLLASLDGALERILTGQELRCDIWANLDWVYLPSDNLKQVTDGFEFRDRLLVFSGTGVGYPSRRTRGAALAGVRLRQHAHQRSNTRITGVGGET